MTAERFERTTDPSVVGDLFRPSTVTGPPVVLAHGAGGNRSNALLQSLAVTFAESGSPALVIDLPYRQKRPKGPPSPSGAARDRSGIREAVNALAVEYPGPIIAGGSSYGGRQASMLAADAPEGLAGLLLLSYPLHPPGKPEKLRTEHLAQIRVPTMFAHGTRDPFGSPSEMESAVGLTSGRTRLLLLEGARHGLPPEAAAEIAAAVLSFFK